MTPTFDFTTYHEISIEQYLDIIHMLYKHTKTDAIQWYYAPDMQCGWQTHLAAPNAAGAYRIKFGMEDVGDHKAILHIVHIALTGIEVPIVYQDFDLAGSREAKTANSYLIPEIQRAMKEYSSKRVQDLIDIF